MNNAVSSQTAVGGGTGPYQAFGWAHSLEDERLDVLGTLIQAYEAKHDPIDPPDPIDAIKFRMEQSDRERPCALHWPTQSRVGGFVSQTTAVALEL